MWALPPTRKGRSCCSSGPVLAFQRHPPHTRLEAAKIAPPVGPAGLGGSLPKIRGKEEPNLLWFPWRASPGPPGCRRCPWPAPCRPWGSGPPRCGSTPDSGRCGWLPAGRGWLRGGPHRRGSPFLPGLLPGR